MTKLASIRVRLTLWYTFFLALIVLGFSVYLHFELQDRLFMQIDEGLRVAASHLLVDVNDTVNPPALHPMSDQAEAYLAQSSFALRLVEADGTVAADVGGFPSLEFSPPATSGFQTVAIDDMPWRIYTQQIETQTTRFDTWLQMGQSLNIVQDTQTNLMRLILLGLPVTLIIALLGGLFTANRALHPVDSITRTVQSITATDMSERVAYQGPNDELGRLTETLNLMLDRIQSAFDAERRFTADASHELRTPLTAIKGQVDVALSQEPRAGRISEGAASNPARDGSPDPRSERPAVSGASGQRTISLEIGAGRLERSAGSGGRAGTGAGKRKVYPSERRRATAPVRAGNCRPSHSPVPQSGRQCRQVHAGGRRNHDHGDAGANRNPCSGEGQRSGDRARTLPHLFERFYRVESDRAYQGGAGLGLAIANQIAIGHGGTIHVESLPAEGACFTASLPLLPTPQK
ncbi:MAG: HAMP domain-containing protein [Anaerolineae bacterium]